MKRFIVALYCIFVGIGTIAFLAAALLGASLAEQPMPDHDRLGLVVAGALFVVGALLYFIGHGLRDLLAADHDGAVELRSRR